MVGPSDELQRPIQLTLCRYGSDIKCVTQCSGCGDSFSSRNALFRHLREHGCGSGVRRRSRRYLVLYGYVGTNYYGSQFNTAAEEARFPTVEGALLEAI